MRPGLASLTALRAVLALSLLLAVALCPSPAFAPPVIIGAAVSAGIAAATGATIFGLSVALSAALIGVANLALGLLTQAMQKKPAASDLGNFSFSARDRALTVRQPVSPWRVVYGEVPRLGGTITFIATSGSSKEYLHVVLTLAAHQVSAIGTMYFDGEEVPLDGSEDNGGGLATGKYDGLVRVQKNLGTADQAAFAGLVSEAVGWTSTHRQRGHAGAYVRLKWDADKFQGLPNITFDITGKADIYDPRGSPQVTGYSANWALCVADYLCDRKRGLGCDFGTEIDEDLVIAAANVSDEDVSLAGGGTQNRYECNGSYTADQKPFDILNALLSAGGGRAVVTAGLWAIYAAAWRSPAFTIVDRDLRGPIRVQARVSRREQFNAVRGIIASEDSRGQPTDFPPVRNGTYETQDSDRASGFTVVGSPALIQLSDTAPVATGTALLFESDGTLPGNLAEDTVFYAIAAGTGLIEVATTRAAALAGTAIELLDAGSGAHMVRFGQTVWKDVDFPFTGSVAAAQRLAKIDLERARQPITVTLQCKLTAWQIRPPDVIGITHSRFGWSAKAFEVVEQTLAIEPDGTLGVDLACRETASAVYDWNSGEETQIDAAPDTNFPDPFSVVNPTGISVETLTAQTLQADTLYQVVASWNAPADQFVTSGGQIEVQWKLSSAMAWQPSFFTAGAQTSTTVTALLELGNVIDIRIRSVNQLGARAATWLESLGYVVGSARSGVDSRYDFGSFSDMPSPVTSWDFGSFGDTPSPLTSYDYGAF